MLDWIVNLDSLGMFYLICSLAGGIPLIVIFIMQILGGDSGGGEADLGDGDFDVSDIEASADISFKFLSFHGLTAFMMMFGLVGLALHTQNGVEPWISLLGGVIAGLASVWVISKIYSMFNKLQTSGTLDTKNAVGSEGEVYLNIPVDDAGKVMIHFNNRLREFSAVSRDNTAIKTGTRIRVTEVSGNNLVVEKIHS